MTKSNQRILVVDDEQDLCEILKFNLETEGYEVETANSAEEAIVLDIPSYDLLLLDVMMGEMSGFALAKKLKADERTSGIPIIFLTARDTENDTVTGFNLGADDYISKPFSYKVLESRVANLIENRKRFRGIYDNQLKTDTGVQADAEKKDAKMPVESSKAIKSVGGDIDSDFYRRFLELLEPQLGNSDLSVEEIAGQMGLGRTQFYRKIKSLTNYSPNELIRHIRLKKARRLLTSSEKSVSEIAYATGFSNPAYFTKCFRDAYGKTPSELREELSIKK